MTTLEITGKLVKVLPEQTGAGKNGAWKKQDFVIETADQYPKKVCISAWGDKVEALKQFSDGDELKVFFNVESREFNERWYTDLKAWKIEGDNVQPSSGSKKTSKSDSEVSTFYSNNSTEDDLPF